MASLGKLLFRGISGSAYESEGYPLGTEFRPLGGVYAVTKLCVSPEGRHSHLVLYVGQTEDLSERLDNHQKAPCWNQHAADRIWVRLVPSKEDRLAMESDLIASYKPACNEVAALGIRSHRRRHGA